PPFRDVSIIKKDEEIYLSVSYPKIREGLVKNFINDFNDINKIEYDSLAYKFWYFGYLDFIKFDEIIKKIYESKFSIIRFRKNKIAYSIYSDKPIVGLEKSLDYSTLENENLFKGCILCGNCITVCPYGKQNNDIFYTPLGFYSFSYFNQVGDIANCHLCGLCEEVCPMKLDITSELRKNSSLREINPNYIISVIKPKSSVLVITPISEGFYDLIIKSIIYLVRKGKKIGIIYLPYNFSKIVKNEINLKELEGVKEIYVISPEEYFYLKRLLAKNIVDIYNIQTLILEELNINIDDVHVPCLLRSDVKTNKIVCSNAFLNLLNGKDNINKEIKNKITLCPLTGKELGIPTPLDILNYNSDHNIANKILDRIKQSINDVGDVLEDINWYSGIDNMIYENLYSSIVNSVIKDESFENLITFYFFAQKLDNIDENLKKIIVSEIEKIIFS
ncbi:4Fe-4S ferredoxin, partial [Sulfolobus sp. E5]